MALIVFDASVVIALLDPAHALHVRAQREFDRVAGEDLALPASALAETLVGPTRAGSLRALTRRLKVAGLCTMSCTRRARCPETGQMAGCRRYFSNFGSVGATALIPPGWRGRQPGIGSAGRAPAPASRHHR